MRSKATIFMLLFTTLLLFSCETVPITGRQQLNLISSQELNAMSFNAYNDFLSKNKVVQGTEGSQMVQRVGYKIQQAVEQYMSAQNMGDRLQGYNWEFNLVEDPSVNAWAMPGGKVVVYTGMLPVAQDEAGLAVVMGHEIAHAVAGHGNERMSQQLLTQLGATVLSTALTKYPAQTQNLFMAAFGAGSQVGILLPYSRLQESEADRLGLIFMAMAGYDPNVALGFWQRMSEDKKGGAPPEFLSTHPASSTRIGNIKNYIPEAMNYYRPS